MLMNDSKTINRAKNEDTCGCQLLFDFAFSNCDPLPPFKRCPNFADFTIIRW